jgi:hypothetical protein
VLKQRRLEHVELSRGIACLEHALAQDGTIEEVVFHIERGDLLDILEHPNPDRYVGQRIFVVRREAYVYLVPFPPSPARHQRGLRRGRDEALRAEADVEDEHRVFLKTIIPSRKATKQYLGEESADEA